MDMFDKNTVEVPLSRGFVALVSLEDADRVLRHKWWITYGGGHKGGKKRMYAATKMGPNATRKNLSLHRFIMNAKEGDVIDHFSENGLDCTRGNLRFATYSQNAANSGPGKKRGNNPSRFKGVSLASKSNKWVASIMKDTKLYRLGSFPTEEAAALIWNRKARELFGEFAYQNDVPDEALCRFEVDYPQFTLNGFKVEESLGIPSTHGLRRRGFYLSFNDSDFDKLRIDAASAGVKISTWVRLLVNHSRLVEPPQPTLATIPISL